MPEVTIRYTCTKCGHGRPCVIEIPDVMDEDDIAAFEPHAGNFYCPIAGTEIPEAEYEDELLEGDE